MPIIQSSRADAPLTQGDILSGVALFATKAGGEENKGGQAALTRFESCLVLSRPCAAAHKKHVVVAGVAKYPDAVPKGIDSFDKVLDFLTGARDGVASPDVIYLGQLPVVHCTPSKSRKIWGGGRNSWPRAGLLPSIRTSPVTCTCGSSAPSRAWVLMTPGGPRQKTFSGW